MCGIISVLKSSEMNISSGIVKRMLTEISHRGPDDEGMIFLSAASSEGWKTYSEANTEWTVALGSRRLSIQDLSDAGHMPMPYQDKFWIVYNGEVYNFIEMRVDLEQRGCTFRSLSDTEVILAAYAEWGPDCFARFRGMWGLIIFDATRQEVILCRDRLGIKPLYLWQGAGMIAVASEIKQFLALPGFTAHVNWATAAEYLQTGYEDPGRSFFRDVQVVPAGSWISIPLDTLVPSTPQHYWYPERVQVAVTDAVEAGRLFAAKLRESVRIHMRSDVPVGCALSGGMDSSSIAMLVDEMKGEQDFPLHTFSCTFPDDPADERKYIEAIVSGIRSMPHYVVPRPESFLEELKPFLYMHDEPIGGASVYASYCIARLTREAGIPVTLNGQGGDELLAGYWQSYFFHLRQLAEHGRVFSLLRHLAGALSKSGNPGLIAQVPVMLRRYHARSKPNTFVRLDKKLREDMAMTEDRPLVLEKILALDEQAWRVEQIRTMFLPRLLRWDDRNSMAFSVEGRYPFLDHELIELCLSFAPETLYHGGWTKWPLRTGLKKSLPQKILSRRSKLGFEVPQDKWLCGTFRPALEKWLKEDRPLWDYVEQSEVYRLADLTWRLSGKREEPGQALFRLFMFDQWIEVFKVVG